MNTQPAAVESAHWSGDLMRDTFTYQMIDISTTLVDLVMENQSISDLYHAWLEDQVQLDAAAGEGEITPVVLTELKNNLGSAIMLLGLPVPGQFLVVFQTKDFNANIIIAQNHDTGELQAASVNEFDGDLTYALTWGRDFINRIDEEMIAAGV